jgi:hypothetical protein
VDSVDRLVKLQNFGEVGSVAKAAEKSAADDYSNASDTERATTVLHQTCPATTTAAASRMANEPGQRV